MGRETWILKAASLREICPGGEAEAGRLLGFLHLRAAGNNSRALVTAGEAVT